MQAYKHTCIHTYTHTYAHTHTSTPKEYSGGHPYTRHHTHDRRVAGGRRVGREDAPHLLNRRRLAHMHVPLRSNDALLGRAGWCPHVWHTPRRPHRTSVHKITKQGGQHRQTQTTENKRKEASGTIQQRKPPLPPHSPNCLPEGGTSAIGSVLFQC